MILKIKLIVSVSILLLLHSCSSYIDNSGQLIFIEANSQDGFNYPYFLFIPEGCSQNSELTLIVEPNNSGFTSDDFNEHVKSAKNVASNDFYLGNYIAQKLKTPILVPVFPRDKSSWKIYTHALDRDVVLQKRTKLERIDLQLIEMISDANDRLNKMGFKVKEKFIMTGFSASGTFANRFSVIHPEKIAAIVAGGINGLLILPRNEYDEKKLNYPIGTNDFKELFGKIFNSNSFKNIPQFMFMGAKDDNDAIPYDDAFDEAERELIFELLGKEMQPKRWRKCIEIYRTENVNARLKTYKNIGHECSTKVKEDILSFLNSVLEN